MTITGVLTLAGGTINANGATIHAGSLNEQWASSSLNGGTYEIAGNFNTAGNVLVDGITANIGGNATFGGNNSSHVYQNSSFNIQGTISIGGGDQTIDGSSISVGLGFPDATTEVVTLNGGTDLDLINGASFTIIGHVNAGNSAEININGSSMHVYGNLDNAGDGDIYVTNSGTFRVDGNYDNSGSGSTNVTGGSLSVGGDYNNTGGGTTNATGGGTINVAGNFDNTNGNTTSNTGGSITSGGGCTGDCMDVSLPVELVNFAVHQVNNSVRIEWTTAMELDNDHFNLYRSNDGIHFDLIQVTKGHGTTARQSNYLYYDSPKSSLTYYYRLEQVDFDGTVEVFEVRKVDYRNITERGLMVYPSPASIEHPITISFQNADDQWVEIALMSISGQIITVRKEELQGGKLTIDTRSQLVNPGTYILMISGHNWSKKIRVQFT